MQNARSVPEALSIYRENMSAEGSNVSKLAVTFRILARKLKKIKESELEEVDGFV